MIMMAESVCAAVCEEIADSKGDIIYESSRGVRRRAEKSLGRCRELQ